MAARKPKREDGVPQFGNNFYGARVGAQWNAIDKFAVFANASGEKTQLWRTGPVFS